MAQEEKNYCNLSIRPAVHEKLRSLAKIEKHTLSDELDFVLDFYIESKKLTVKKELEA